MALSNAEIQKQWRERQKTKRQKATDATSNDLRRPFHDWLAANRINWDEFVIPLDIAGITPPEFEDNRDPSSATGEIDINIYAGKRGSIARAELTVDGLLEAARALAEHVNAYKREEISARIEELENANLTDPVTRKDALADIVRLTKARDRLDKQVRYTLPEWKVSGE